MGGSRAQPTAPDHYPFTSMSKPIKNLKKKFEIAGAMSAASYLRPGLFAGKVAIVTGGGTHDTCTMCARRH